MSPLLRRGLPVLLPALLLVLAALAMQQDNPPTHTFRIVLGLHDKEPTDWSGQVAVTGGTVEKIEGWRFESKDKVKGTSGWTCQTRKFVAPNKRLPVQLGNGERRVPPDLEPWPNGVTLTVRGQAPRLVLQLPRGKVQFAVSEIKFGTPHTVLDGQVRIEKMPAVAVLRPAASPNTPDAVQDDYPAFWVHYSTNKHYLAWIAYQKGKDRVLLAERDGSDGPWSEPLEVAPGGYHFRTALATTHDGILWITWASMHEGNWDLYARPYRHGKLGEAVRLTEAAGPDLWQRMTTDNRGRAWLVWQGFREGQADIFARCADEKGWHKPIQVSDSARNDWNPCITADTKTDRVWVGWDTHTGDNYSVRVRSLSGGAEAKAGGLLTPEACPLFQAHISLACDRDGRLWAAWDESGPQWGKDFGFLYGSTKRLSTTRLYASRALRIQCLDNGQWREPKAAFQSCLPADMQEFNELPQLQTDSAGRLWLAFRHRTCRNPREDGWASQGRWDIFATAYEGDRWLTPISLPEAGGRNDMRTSSQRDPQGNVYFAHATDNRGWFPPSMLPRNHSIAVSRLKADTGCRQPELVERKRDYPVAAPCHPREQEQVARIRSYKVAAGGKTYHIYRGDIHRHTDISSDGVGDGSLLDLHRYGLDAAAFDYILITDHNMGQDNEYCWWRTQQANDLYTVPGKFISMYGYERSMPYPNGHRNVIWTRRGYRTLPLAKPIPAQLQRDTAKLYANLRETGGICTAHTSATSQGTDWEVPHDPLLEPMVEVFQGYHTSYEAPGAPKSIDAETDRIHGKFEPAGFISKALAKGYRLGFQSSSDHISTHVSYACVLAEDFSRTGLVAAMKQRHTYAATDNIVLDVRLNGRLMGEEVRTRQPRLEVVVLGTGPIEKVEVIRNNEVMHTVQPKDNAEEVRFDWQDPRPVEGQPVSYYYVRVLQRDGQMAWASPIWALR